MNIVESSDNVTFNKVDLASCASAVEVIMDEEFIKRNRHDWFWMNGSGVPNVTGWYWVKRDIKQLEKIDNMMAENLQWHERVFIYSSGHAAVRDDLPLALYIGDEYSDGRLSGLYLCGPDVLTRVALKKKQNNN